MIRIIAIGKRHDNAVASAIEDYQKRLKAPYDTEWLLIPHSALSGDQARSEESRRLIDKLLPNDYVILLDERGELLDNVDLENKISGALRQPRRVVCIIGGAYGVDGSLHQRADLVWSLSPLVFPHQLVRIILIEQIYRSQSLAQGHPYHHS